jgi:hypothetical protein
VISFRRTMIKILNVSLQYLHIVSNNYKNQIHKDKRTQFQLKYFGFGGIVNLVIREFPEEPAL